MSMRDLIKFDVFDFPGLVRSIATFSEIDEDDLDITFDLHERRCASVDSGWNINASLVNLDGLDGMNLLFIAAHEIGHIMWCHFQPSIKRRLKRMISRNRMDDLEEDEADWFASLYSVEHDPNGWD